jgi:hypothetical protein
MLPAEIGEKFMGWLNDDPPITERILEPDAPKEAKEAYTRAQELLKDFRIWIASNTDRELTLKPEAPKEAKKAYEAYMELFLDELDIWEKNQTWEERGLKPNAPKEAKEAYAKFLAICKHGRETGEKV